MSSQNHSSQSLICSSSQVKILCKNYRVHSRWENHVRNFFLSEGRKLFLFIVSRYMSSLTSIHSFVFHAHTHLFQHFLVNLSSVALIDFPYRRRIFIKIITHTQESRLREMMLHGENEAIWLIIYWSDASLWVIVSATAVSM